MSRQMSKESNLVDESRLLWTHVALVDFLAFVVVNEMLFEVSFITKDFPAKRASDFIDHVSVAEVILEDALRRIAFVANVA